MRKLFVVLIVTFLFLVLPKETFAAPNKVKLDLSYVYTVNSLGKLNIEVSSKYTNESPGYLVTFPNKSEFLLYALKKYENKEDLVKSLDSQLNSLRISLNNTSVAYTVDKKEEEYNVGFNINRQIPYKQSLTVTKKYENIDLVEHIGNIYNIYIPESPQISAETLNNFNISLTTKLIISKDLGPINFSTGEYKDDGKTYTFDLSSKENSKKTHLVQIGSSQTWKFKLVQKVDTKNSDGLNLIKYELELPHNDTSLNQEVFFSSFSPLPEQVVFDKEGNTTAMYYLDSSISEIVVEGFAVLNKNNNISNTFIPDKTKYTSPERYWESDNPLILNESSKFKSTSVTDKISETYDFVVSKVDYDNLKLGINNVRQGAVATLKNGSGVCMEYSDLLITMLRAQGIPSRAVFGYGYDPSKKNTLPEKHQWVQAYVEDKGWISIDPTWGNTSRRFIGSDFDHFSWFYSTNNVDTPPEGIRLGAVTGETSFNNPDIFIEPVEGNVLTEKLIKANVLSDTFKLDTLNSLIFSIRTYLNLKYLIGGLSVILLIFLGSRVFRFIRHRQ
jgi:hypothetical protein